MSVADSELLRRYVDDQDEGSFTQLLQRHVNLVYSTALRQIGDDSGAAEEVTQTVFADLARKSTRLRNHPSLAGWLYSSVRLAAVEHRRREGRRQIREARFASMIDTLSSPTSPPEWSRIRPVLDEAMTQLSASDRDAILLRYFEGQSHADIGRQLGVSENTARMRISRALETLREVLGKRGVVTSAGEALAVLLAHHAVGAAPAGLVDRIGLRVFAYSRTTVRLAPRISRSTAGVMVVGFLTVLMLTGVWIATHREPDLQSTRAEVASSAVESDAATSGSPTKADPSSSAEVASPATLAVPTENRAGDRFLVLTVVAKDSGKPIPNVMLDQLMRTVPGPLGFSSRKVATTRDGRAWIRVPSEVLFIDLTTRTEGFADTRLRWEPPLGHRIPTNYLLQLDQAVTLGGMVVDSEGQPVAGATVGIHQEQRASEIGGFESHEFGSITATTDEEGRWSRTRVASGVVARCRVSAAHPDHQPSESVDLAAATEAEAALRQQRHVLHLTPARILKGIVVDEVGQGIEEARVVVTHPTRRDVVTSADGEFEVSGAPIGNHWINVTAPGFAPARFPIHPPPEGEPVRLALERAGAVRFRVLDTAGQPVSNAWFAFSVNPWETSPEPNFPSPPPLASFAAGVDEEGRGRWTNAPPGTPRFDFMAVGYERRFSVPITADDLEHEVILERVANLVIQGEVKNAVTGHTIPSFRLVLGYLSRNTPGQSKVGFLDEERTRLRFEGGRFRHAFTEPIMRGTGDSRVVVKVEADGFQPWFSPPLKLDEGEVRLDVVLKPAEDFTVAVFLPDGRPAMRAEVGLVRPEERLSLSGTRFARGLGDDPSGFRSADPQGRVRLSSDDRVTRVLVAHPDGFVAVPLDSLSEGSVVTLQPWARIEVEFSGGDAGVHHAGVQPVDVESADLELDFETAHVQADPQGHAVFNSIPPGEWNVRQVRPVVTSAGPTMWQPGRAARVRVEPGESVRVALGGGYRVTGRIRLPVGFKEPKNSQWIGSIHSGSPQLPVELQGDPARIDLWRQQPEIRESIDRENQRSRFLAVNAEGHFTADSVEPGEYQLELTLLVTPEQTLDGGVVHGPPPRLTVRQSLHVPESPNSGELDLGWVSAEVIASTVPR